MTPELALQKALLNRLLGTVAVTDLVPASNILDRNARPIPDPSIILGEGQTVEGGDIARKTVDVFLTLHIWAKGTGLVAVKAIGGAVRQAVHSGRLELSGGFHCGDCRVSSLRFMRDPDGETGHGVVTVEAMVKEA